MSTCARKQECCGKVHHKEYVYALACTFHKFHYKNVYRQVHVHMAPRSTSATPENLIL